MRNVRKLYENQISFYLISIGIPMVLMGAVCLLMRITPFGDHSFLIADMEKQYIDFLAYYKELFRGNHGIFYTFGKCLGGDMFGFFTYYLTSPLNLLLLLVPLSALPSAVTLLILVKMSLCGLTMSIYLRKHFSCPSHLLPCLWIFSSGYAMMSFLMANCFNIMWHEPIILFPLVILGLESLVLEKKFKLYVLSLAASLFCNYYITYMICIFCVLYFLGFVILHWEKERFLARIGHFVGFSALSGGLCATFLLPTFFTIGGSLKDEKAVAIGVTHINVSPLHVLSKLLTFSFSSNELMNGMPNLFCGLLVVVLVPVFFFHRKIRLREKLVYLSLLLLLLISFCNAKLDYAWHAFMEPSGYPFRYSFLFSFLLLVLACQGLLVIAEQGFTLSDALPSMLCVLLLFILVLCQNYEYINERYELSDLALFFILWACLFCLYHQKVQLSVEWIRKAFVTLLILLQLMTLTLSNLLIYRSLRNTSYSPVSKYEALYQPITDAVDALKAQDSSFYRMENLNRSTLNNSMHYGYAGLSHYSSNEQYFVLHFLEEMGLNYDRLYLEYGQGSTVTLDSLLGVKYLLANEDSLNKPYDERIPSQSEGGLSVYQNPYALPIALMADESIASASIDSTNPFSMEEDIYRSLSNSNVSSDSIFENAVESVQETNQGVTYTLKAESDGYIFMYGDADEILPDGAIYVDGELISDYYNLHRWCVMNLGYHQKGETCQVSLTSTSPGKIGPAYFVTENLDVLARYYDALDLSEAVLHKFYDSHLQIEANADKHSMLLLTVPYEENWHIKVDGKKIQATKVFNTFMAVPLSSGNHLVEFHYIPKGIVLGLCISLVSLLFFLCLAYFNRFIQWSAMDSQFWHAG